MIARIVVALTLIASALLVSSSAQAGGWASVRMLEGNPNPVVGQLWQAALIVKQHDTHEVDVDELNVHFVHESSGATMDVKGVSTGEIGHYLIELRFEELGLWNWSATPAPFAATNMPSLDVLEHTAAANTELPKVSFALGTCEDHEGSFGDLTLDRSESSYGVTMASGVINDRAFIQKYVAGGSGSIAVVVRPATDSATTLACGQLTSISLDKPQALVLEPIDGSDWTGTISLFPVGNAIIASVALVGQTATNAVEIHIKDMSQAVFDPSEITVPVGTTVTWVNDSVMAHTITGSGAPGFRNSGMIDPGQTFSQTFTEPGTYGYICDPHQWMVGTIVVTG